MLREFAYEEITVDASVKKLTAATFKPGDGHSSAQKAFVQVLSAGIRHKLNGTDPSSSTGFAESAGGSFVLENEAEIEGFRFTRSGGADAKLIIAYLRKM